MIEVGGIYEWFPLHAYNRESARFLRGAKGFEPPMVIVIIEPVENTDFREWKALIQNGNIITVFEKNVKELKVDSK